MNTKIVHVVLGKANPERMNGVNVVAHNLLKSAAEAGGYVELCGITHDFLNPPENRGYDVYLFNKFKLFPSRELINYIKLRAAEGAIFHFHGLFIYQFFIICLLLKFFGIKWGITVHGALSPYALNISRFNKKIYSILTDWFFLKRASYVHALTQNEMDNVKNAAPSLNVIVVPNGITPIDLASYKNIPGINDYFLFLGRLSYEKGVDILIESFERYCQKGGIKNLFVAGDGPEFVKIKSIISDKGLNDRVKMLGAVYGRDKYNLLTQCHCVILPSRTEGFPIVALEAGGVGKPVIVSKETNLSDIVLDNNLGLVLRKNNNNYLSQAMLEFDRNATFDSGNIKDFIMTRFSWDKVANSLHTQVVSICS